MINIEANNFLILSESLQKRLCMRGRCNLCQYLEEHTVLQTKEGCWICTDNMEKNIIERLEKLLRPKTKKS